MYIQRVRGIECIIGLKKVKVRLIKHTNWSKDLCSLLLIV